MRYISAATSSKIQVSGWLAVGVDSSWQSISQFEPPPPRIVTPTLYFNSLFSPRYHPSYPYPFSSFLFPPGLHCLNEEFSLGLWRHSIDAMPQIHDMVLASTLSQNIFCSLLIPILPELFITSTRKTTLLSDESIFQSMNLLSFNRMSMWRPPNLANQLKLMSGTKRS